MSKKVEQAKAMGEFVDYVKPDTNIKKYYDEFEDAGPVERAELYRCRSIERHIEGHRGSGPLDDSDWDD